jgi:hypothetical protein
VGALFDDAAAKWVAETAVQLMLEEYVEGKDPGLIIDGLLGRMVDYLKKQGSDALKKATNEAIATALKPVLDKIAKAIKSEIQEQFPSEQWVRAELSDEDCIQALHISWEFKGGGYRAVLTIHCGPNDPDAISAIVIKLQPVKPGEASSVTVQVLNQLKVPFPLGSATIIGLAAVMPDGSPEPNAAIAGRMAVFAFTAAKPRRDGKFPLTITVTTDKSTGGLTGKQTVDLEVVNVEPTIESVTGASASAEPGDELQVKGARVLVIDDNADARNPGEVTVASLKLAHPAGLNTAPHFDKADSPRQVSFDGGSGHYVFEFNRTGRVAEPHAHGTWAVGVSIADNNALTATSTFDLEVLDAAPTAKPIIATPKFVHSGDGRAINVTAKFTDKNGVDDLVGYSIDATKAGGGTYTNKNGLSETGRGADYVEVRVTTPFVHTDDPGQHLIPVEVHDEKNAGSGTDFIVVGNEKPEVRGSGYVYGFDGNPVDVAAVKEAPKQLCPNDPFRVGVILADAEGDPLTATVTIVETGQTVDLTNSSENIWIADLRAPGTPGTYTLRFVGTEKPPQKESVSTTLTFVVRACTFSGLNTAVAIGSAANPTDITNAPRDETSQRFAGAFQGSTVPRTSGAGPGGSDAEQVLRQALDEAIGSGPSDAPTPPQGAPTVEAYLIALGNSTGAAVQFFAVNRSGQAIQLPATMLVLEPVRITPGAQTRITQVVQGLVDAGGRPEIVDAYCLEFLRKPPAAGTVLRIAAPALQQQYARHAKLLDAALRLKDLGKLAPDSDPADYFHAIRQWAVWTLEERFDARRFADAFIEVTKRNYQAAGTPWTAEVERAFRALTPNRWTDVQAVLKEAGLEVR